MALANRSAWKQRTQLFTWTLLLVAGIVTATTNCHAYQDSARRPVPVQNLPKANTAKAPATQDWMADLKKNPELLSEIGKLIARMQQEVHLPGPRRQSQILPRLNDSTNIYAAFPNYGEALNQAHMIFKQQLKDSPALQDWWQKSDANKSDPKFDDVLDLIYQFSQYLGDEIVGSGSYQDKTGILIAEVKKPGLEKFLPEMYRKLSGKSGSGTLQVLTPQQLATAKPSSGDGAFALIRPDFVVIGTDLNAIRALNAQIEAGNKGFSSTAFGQRMTQAYVDGTSTLVGLDLQPMIPDFTKIASQRALLKASGFGDMKYAVWEMNDHNGGVELSFISPRHGIASWLANSAPLGGLDFLSPSATMAGSILLKSPAQILDDYRDIATTVNPASLDMLAQMQMGMGIDLRNDLLSKLDGEIAYEMDTPLMPSGAAMDKPVANKPTPAAQPTWRLALRVNDAVGLQQTFSKLLSASRMDVKHLAEGKLTVHSFQIPSQPEPLSINYAFADGYLLVGSSRATVSEALRVHQAGESLAKSAKFRAALPDNQAQVASALYYQNVGSWMSMVMKQLPAEFTQSLPPLSTTDMSSAVSAIYGSDRAIRATGGNNTTNSAVVMVIAAMAIPNLLRARTAADEAAAGASIRTINTAQVTYSVTYPNKGYAADLATLGPGTSDTCNDPKSVTEKHACLLDGVLGNASCKSGSWCRKGAYNYSVSATCRFGTCPGYVAVSTPANAESGTKSFCSVEDAVVRVREGSPLASPISAAECKRWLPVR